MAHRYGLIGLLGMGRRGLGKLAPRGDGGRGRMEGGRLSSGLTCGPGAPPWNPPLAARSRCVVQTPLPGEERRKTTLRRKGRCSGKDGGDKGGRAQTIGHFQGLWPHAGPLGRSLDGRLTGKRLPFYFMWCLQTTSTPHNPAAGEGQQAAVLADHLWASGCFFFLVFISTLTLPPVHLYALIFYEGLWSIARKKKKDERLNLRPLCRLQVLFFFLNLYTKFYIWWECLRIKISLQRWQARVPRAGCFTSEKPKRQTVSLSTKALSSETA